MKIPVMIPNHEYDIILERGALAHLADYVKIQGKVLLITDTGVPQAHIELVSAQLADCDCYIVEQGEGSKSFTVLQKILSYMLAHDFQRSDCVIALGGGRRFSRFCRKYLHARDPFYQFSDDDFGTDRQQHRRKDRNQFRWCEKCDRCVLSALLGHH